jgi:capsular exopolysaccharide synthesis family protein
MGRVYEALKRAAEHGDANTKKTNDANNTSRRASAATAVVDDEEATLLTESSNGASGNGHSNGERDGLGNMATPEFVMRRTAAATTSALFNAPDTAHNSASAEHIDAATVGSALPGRQASRVAGATADAVSSARALEFPTQEISHARVEPHLIAITDPRSPHAEQYRALRTRILHAGEKRKVQAIVVSSAGVMEGKTVTALNLAWLLAQTDGVRALLIDGDLRRPCAAEYLGIDAPAGGLSEVLAGETTLEKSIIRLEPAGLHLLPGGTVRDNVAEILSGPKFSKLLAELRRMFDFIIIDAPPLGIFTDATVLINRADGALMVVRSGKTRYAALDRVLEPLPRERLLGIVLNGADDNNDDSSSYYQRRYYRRDENKEVMNAER